MKEIRDSQYKGGLSTTVTFDEKFLWFIKMVYEKLDLSGFGYALSQPKPKPVSDERAEPAQK